MSNSELTFPVPEQWQRRAWIDEPTYRREYERSLRDPQRFWAEQAERLDWFKSPTRIRDVSLRRRTTCTSAGSKTACSTPA